VCDFIFVIEFQNHGNEHDHGLLCIKDAPIYGINRNEEIEIFVYKCISCDILLLPITIQNAKHQHIQTCKKQNHFVCRFHHPLPPMNKTTILKPLELKEDLPSKKNKFATSNKFF
jgi:hypothetical protein